MIRLLAMLVGYLCVGTLAAQVVLGSYLWASGKMNKEKTFRILAIMHDVQLDEPEPALQRPDSSGQPRPWSYEELESLRNVKLRHLELKKQSLQQGLSQIDFERRELAKDRERYVQLRNAFDSRLDELREETENQGYANVRLIWENIQPKKAKEQILMMVDAGEMEDVVHILSEMPIGKRARIVNQFNSEEEMETLDKILRNIRRGGPLSTLIDETLDETEAQ